MTNYLRVWMALFWFADKSLIAPGCDIPYLGGLIRER